MHLDAIIDPLERLCVMLCIALALVFAGTSLSSVTDKIQHAPGATAQHQHLLFSEMADEGLHLDDHPLQGGDEENSGTPHAPSGHHHHGDSGAGLLSMADNGPALPQPSARLIGLEPSQMVAGLRIPGPERPPKSPAIGT